MKGNFWRAGALWGSMAYGCQRSHTLQVENDVLIEGELLSAGKYALFTIPGEFDCQVL